MSRDLEDLQPWFQPKARHFLLRCEQAGYPLRIIRTLTDDATQAALFAIGRRNLTAAEARLLREERLYPDDLTATRTKAQTARETAHGQGLAFDVIPLKDGKPWNPPGLVWRALYVIAETCGLDALGDPQGEYVPGDRGHFQEPGWRIYREPMRALPSPSPLPMGEGQGEGAHDGGRR